jgi:hypothetical protein
MNTRKSLKVICAYILPIVAILVAAASLYVSNRSASEERPLLLIRSDTKKTQFSTGETNAWSENVVRELRDQCVELMVASQALQYYSRKGLLSRSDAITSVEADLDQIRQHVTKFSVLFPLTLYVSNNGRSATTIIGSRITIRWLSLPEITRHNMPEFNVPIEAGTTKSFEANIVVVGDWTPEQAREVILGDEYLLAQVSIMLAKDTAANTNFIDHALSRLDAPHAFNKQSAPGNPLVSVELYDQHGRVYHAQPRLGAEKRIHER